MYFLCNEYLIVKFDKLFFYIKFPFQCILNYFLFFFKLHQIFLSSIKVLPHNKTLLKNILFKIIVVMFRT